MSLVVVSGGQNQVDLGVDNPTSYIPFYHETRKGGQGPIQGWSATKEERLSVLPTPLFSCASLSRSMGHLLKERMRELLFQSLAFFSVRLLDTYVFWMISQFLTYSGTGLHHISQFAEWLTPHKSERFLTK
jgi:hypothetical protein